MAANPIHRLFETPASLAPTILRWLLCGLFFQYAAQKTLGWFGGSGWDATVQALSSASGPGLSYSLIVALVTAEFLFAGLFFIGFFTRLCALGTLILMGGSLLTHTAQQAPVVFELELALAVIGLALLFIGGGRFSLDRAIGKNLLPEIG